MYNESVRRRLALRLVNTSNGNDNNKVRGGGYGQ